MMYATAARAEEVLRVDITDLHRPDRRARTRRQDGKADGLLYGIRTARLLGELLVGRSGPIFLSRHAGSDDGTVLTPELGPVGRRRRMSYRSGERCLTAAPGGWDPHDLRRSRLTQASKSGATDTDPMNLFGRRDRRTLQRCSIPSKDGTHRRVDDIDARAAWAPGAAGLATRPTLTAAVQPAPAVVARLG